MTKRRMQPEALLLPLKRPEYYSVPEALLSALAWRAYERPKSDELIGRGADDASSESRDAQKPSGYMYQATPRDLPSISLRATRPQGTVSKGVGRHLKESGGWSTEASDEELGDAVASSVLGIRIEKTGNQPASPLSPALALLQDPRGILVKAGPPDFGDIIESFFALGHNRPPVSTATDRWLASTQVRLHNDKLLAAIDDAVLKVVLNGSVKPSSKNTTLDKITPWFGMFPGTPFEWFAESWKTLTDADWVAALPSRVWVDWATTILRLGVGLGFLWEYAWYEAIGAAIVKGKVPESFEELVSSVPSPLPWKSSSCTISIRDVGSEIKWRITRGEKVRQFLDKELKAYRKDAPDQDLDAISFLNLLVDNKNELKKTLDDKTQAGKAVWETVKYGLQIREQSGPFTDYYGLLKTRSRNYLVVEPGTEWMAVVASLACNEPGGHCNVGAVLTSLSHMGMRPEQTEVIELLERAGLARGSADADHAVIVESAF